MWHSLMCGLAVDYAEMLDDVNYLRVCWRVQNRWPERVFGWMARSMHMEGLTLLRHYQYMRLPTMLDARTRPAGSRGTARSGSTTSTV